MAKRRPIEPEKIDQHEPVFNAVIQTQQINREAQITAERQQSQQPIRRSSNNR